MDNRTPAHPEPAHPEPTHTEPVHPGPLDAMRLAHQVGLAHVTAPEAVNLSQCVGRTLAGPVHVVRDVPHYDSSAMDGFAVSGPPPWQVLTDSAATQPTSRALPVATGSPVPGWATSVVRQEWVGDLGDGLTLNPGAPTRDLAPGRNIRLSGREARAGELVAPAGCALSPAQVAFAAVAGHDELEVRARPRVGVLLTGAEVDPTGLPTPGRVRDTYGPQLPAYLQLMGADVLRVVRIGDERAETERAVHDLAHECDLIVSTGGTGHSQVDELRRVAESCVGEAGRVVFSQLKMRPGHPTFLMEHSGVVHVGLPGNPLAAMVAVRVVLVPLVRGMLGRPVESRVQVALAEDFDPGHGRGDAGQPGGRAGKAPMAEARVMPARPSSSAVDSAGLGATADSAGLGATVDSAVRANAAFDSSEVAWELCDKHGSNMLRGMAAAQGLVIIPPGGAGRGDSVQMLPLPL